MASRLKAKSGNWYHTTVVARSKAEADAVAAGARAAGSRVRVSHSKGYQGQHPHYLVKIG